MHRDPGIAAKKQRRQAEQAERLAVRKIVRQQLSGGSAAGADTTELAA
jgi:hypothetical protein